jgi:serine/threonine protein kinase
MIDVAEDWLKSGEYAEIAGLKLRPIENPLLKGVPLTKVHGKARAFYLIDDNNFNWILKRFFPGRHPGGNYLRAVTGLVPPRSGFQSGYLRGILSKDDVSTIGFFSEDFASWIENTVLMSRVMGADWAFLADRMRSGALTIPNDERLLLCRRLSEHVSVLEDNNLSHRNLSTTSIFIDEKALSLHLIDWDEIFHPTLAMPHNACSSSYGYIAPFVNKSGRPDSLMTWRPQADRFSMTILNAEFLGLNAGSPIEGDGGMFDQEELYRRGGAGIARILDTLKKNFPGADSLLKRALDARGFDDCPSPAEWIAFSSGVAAPFDTGATHGGAGPPIQFYSCFISYSNKDEEFAKRLYSRLRDAGLRVWFAPENAKGGQKLFEQVDRAIQMHDRLLLVLSENSLHSNWVEQEIRRAREFERKGGPRKLFPIRLTDYETLQEWVCMDTKAVEDLAEEVRSYYIPDFSNWKSYDDFEKAFERLLDDLKPSA